VVDIAIDYGFFPDRSAPGTAGPRLLRELVQHLDLVAVQGRGARAELEAVVLGWVVRPRDLNAAGHADVMQRPIEERRRHHADVDDVASGAGQAIDQSVA